MRERDAVSTGPTRGDEDDRPPFGRGWTLLYALVILNLAVLIVLFTIFTRAFS